MQNLCLIYCHIDPNVHCKRLVGEEIKEKILSLELHEAMFVMNKKGKQSTVLLSSLKLL